MTALEELQAAIDNQRFATGNDDLLLGRAIIELSHKFDDLIEALQQAQAEIAGEDSDDDE